MIRNRPLVNSISAFLALLALVCLLLCTLSTPIVRGIWLFEATSPGGGGQGTQVSFGVFGGCGTTSNFRRYTPGSNSNSQVSYCTPTELSYEILTSEQYQSGANQWSFRPTTLINHNTTSALILNPIAAGMAGLAMILAAIAAFLKGRIMQGLSAGVLSLAALMSWAAFAIDLAIGLIAQQAVSSRRSIEGIPGTSSTSRFHWGAVMPLALIASVLLSVSVAFSVLSFFLSSKSQTSRRYGYGTEKTVGRGSVSTY